MTRPCAHNRIYSTSFDIAHERRRRDYTEIIKNHFDCVILTRDRFIVFRSKIVLFFGTSRLISFWNLQIARECELSVEEQAWQIDVSKMESMAWKIFLSPNGSFICFRADLLLNHTTTTEFLYEPLNLQFFVYYTSSRPIEQKKNAKFNTYFTLSQHLAS